jgi:hypothetical protein
MDALPAAILSPETLLRRHRLLATAKGKNAPAQPRPISSIANSSKDARASVPKHVPVRFGTTVMKIDSETAPAARRQASRRQKHAASITSSQECRMREHSRPRARTQRVDLREKPGVAGKYSCRSRRKGGKQEKKEEKNRRKFVLNTPKSVREAAAPASRRSGIGARWARRGDAGNTLEHTK